MSCKEAKDKNETTPYNQRYDILRNMGFKNIPKQLIASGRENK